MIHVQAAVLAPRPELMVLLTEIVQRVAASDPQDARPRRGVLLRRRRAQPVEDPSMTLLPPEGMFISLATFGMVTVRRQQELAEALRRDVAGGACRRLSLRFERGHLQAGPDAAAAHTAWMGIGGDSKDLARLSDAVGLSVQSLGIFIDRRRFRPAMRLGEVPTGATQDYRDRLSAQLAEYRGPTWPADAISLLQLTTTSAGVVAHELDRIPLPS